ncbi:unnamed protein product [Protopolystoma xenopodis]|uniref:Uncharacterized protein n=1 Tax=Protopolystoma xenopodis TaxID=117903 RepID=A0A3S5C9B3_9PLAT|nr:unnamed protein product [Protopolystoma xenopodis]
MNGASLYFPSLPSSLGLSFGLSTCAPSVLFHPHAGVSYLVRHKSNRLAFFYYTRKRDSSLVSGSNQAARHGPQRLTSDLAAGRTLLGLLKRPAPPRRGSPLFCLSWPGRQLTDPPAEQDRRQQASMQV